MPIEISWQNRIESLKEKLSRLLAGKKFCWKDIDSSLWKNIPEKPGVYVIIEEECRYIYVGESKNLRRRLMTHGRGNPSGDTFNNKLIKARQILSRQDRKKFIKERCFFRFIEVREDKDRKNIEHFTIAALNSELND